MKYLFLVILILSFAISPLFAESPISESDYGRVLTAYYKDVDLNGDGVAESFKVIEPRRFFHNQYDDPAFDYGDDTGTIIRIFNDLGNEIYWDEVSRWQSVNEVWLKNTDDDDLQDIIVSFKEDQDYAATAYVYKWDGSGFNKEEDKFWTTITDEMMMGDRYIIVVKATYAYGEAVRFAEEAGALLGLEFKNEGREYSKEKGIYFSEDIDDPDYAGGYYPRRYSDEYISLENASAYPEFADKSIIVVAGIYSEEEEALAGLEKVRAYYQDAYVKKTRMWMGCIH